jgi:RHS repeat-associated protein
MITQGSGADARQFLITYNNQGYPATMSGPLSAKTDLEYNASGRVLRQILGDGRTVSYGYDAAGNIASITPPGKLSHLFTYSPINLAQEYTTPDAGAGVSVTTFTYDQDKKLTSMTRPDGSAITMAYDSAGRPATKTFDRGTLNYGYDPVTGMLSSLTAPDGGALTMEYDGFLTIKSAWTGAVTGIIDRVYDNNFWLTRRNVNDQAIDFDYENDGLLVQAGTLTLTRDVANGLVTATVLGGVSDTWHYTGFGELDEYGVTYNGSDYFTTQYIYDKLGRIVQKTEEIMGMGSNVYGYSYDVTSRLTGVSLNGVNISTYTYDSNGNRLSFVSPSTTISGSYDAQDRLTQYGDMTYTYTANGELESKTDAGGTTTYQYDSLGNLMSATIPGGTAIEYIIDGANRRIGKKVNNVLVKGLLYKNELKPVAELDGGNNVVSRFVFGSRGNVPDYMITNNATYRIISDHLGSPRLVIDVATGQIAQRLDYDEFGKVLVDTNPGFQPFGFAGGLYDPDTGLVRFGARDYDPQTGRWTAKDLILFLGGDTNLYAYALNNPLNYLDIDGRQGGVDPPPGTSEPRTDFGDGDWQEAAITQVRPNDPRIPRNIADGPVHVVVSCFHGTCTETVWDPRKEKSLEAQVSLDCQGTDCGDLNKRAFKQFLDFDPSNPFPGESLPPAQPLAPSSSLDLPPLVPIPLSSGGKSCNLNIWRDASGNIIDVIKVK